MNVQEFKRMNKKSLAKKLKKKVKEQGRKRPSKPDPRYKEYDDR